MRPTLAPLLALAALTPAAAADVVVLNGSEMTPGEISASLVKHAGNKNLAVIFILLQPEDLPQPPSQSGSMECYFVADDGNLDTLRREIARILDLPETPEEAASQPEPEKAFLGKAK